MPCSMNGRLPVVCAALFVSGATAAAPHPEWTLYTPFSSPQTHLLDLRGDIVHTWQSAFNPGLSVYLLDDGAIMRTANDPSVVNFGGGGVGGRVQRIAWDGTIEWSYVAAGPDHTQHHDIEVLPNGNVLVMVWERFSAAEAIAVGRNPAQVGLDVWAEAIFEVRQTGPTTGEIVWEWHVWDHLIQDFDDTLPDYGSPADNPHRIDINFGPANADWLHWNGLDYNAELDQIVISNRNFNEIWIIAHDPDDPGDLLYRWGNPLAYGRGTADDQKLFGQHNPEWIPEGTPGAGKITVFNNGAGRGYSSIDVIDTAVNPDGTYDLPSIGPFLPLDPEFTCDRIDGEQFFASFISGVHRLPNGNFLVCLGPSGDFVEVDESCNSVWDYDALATVFRATRIDERDDRLQGLLWLEGDATGDGVVDVDDLVAVITDWGCMDPPGPCHGDVDGNGVVDVDDLVLVVLRWGNALP